MIIIIRTAYIFCALNIVQFLLYCRNLNDFRFLVFHQVFICKQIILCTPTLSSVVRLISVNGFENNKFETRYSQQGMNDFRIFRIETLWAGTTSL